MKVATANDADGRISIDRGKVKRGRASKERVPGGGRVKSARLQRERDEADERTDGRRILDKWIKRKLLNSV